MFCTQCGTKIEEGKNFCKTCGARLAKGNEPGTPAREPETVSPLRKTPSEGATVIIERTQALPISPSREGCGLNKNVVAAAIVGIVVVAGLGLYFGTDLFRSRAGETSSPEARQEVPQIAESTAVLPVEPPKTDVASVETLASDSDFNSPLWTKSAEAPLSATTETPATAAKESRSESAPKPEPPAVARKSQTQPAPSEASARKRASTPSSAARPGAIPGIYQTVRPTRVHESPSLSSRVVARIEDGVRVNVVGSAGDWLEVRSRTGNPPGFIRRDDAVLLE